MMRTTAPSWCSVAASISVPDHFKACTCRSSGDFVESAKEALHVEDGGARVDLDEEVVLRLRVAALTVGAREREGSGAIAPTPYALMNAAAVPMTVAVAQSDAWLPRRSAGQAYWSNLTAAVPSHHSRPPHGNGRYRDSSDKSRALSGAPRLRTKSGAA